MTEDEPADEPSRSGRGGSAKRSESFDIALGARIRALRVAADLSQADLGRAIGIGFQQVQRYERGRESVAVSTLQLIADVLDIHPGTFFSGDMPAPIGSRPDQRAARDAAAVLQRIRDPDILKQLVALAKVLGHDVDGAGFQQAKTDNGLALPWADVQATRTALARRRALGKAAGAKNLPKAR